MENNDREEIEGPETDDIVRRLNDSTDKQIVQETISFFYPKGLREGDRQRREDKIPLKGYLASALTGLDKESREEIFSAQDLIAAVCDEHGIDLYQPRHATDPIHHADVAPGKVFATDRERVLESDVLVVLTHEPSFGAGQELEFARNAMLPIILVIRHGQPVSRMVLGIPSTLYRVTYRSESELRPSFSDAIDLLMPLLLERKFAFGNYDSAVIGRNIQMFREENRLSRDDLARAVGLPVEEIGRYEEKPDHLTNPPIIVLRKLATALKVSVTELIVPDFAGTIASQVVQVLHTAATPGGARDVKTLSTTDRRRIWIRVLRKALKEMERD